MTLRSPHRHHNEARTRPPRQDLTRHLVTLVAAAMLLAAPSAATAQYGGMYEDPDTPTNRQGSRGQTRQTRAGGGDGGKRFAHIPVPKDPSQRALYYNSYSKSGVGAFFLELLIPVPGVGVMYAGSYKQGGILMGLGGVGVALMISAGEVSSDEVSVPLLVGAILYLSARLSGWIVAPIAASAHNKRLRQHLGISSDLDGFAPSSPRTGPGRPPPDSKEGFGYGDYSLRLRPEPTRAFVLPVLSLQF